MDGDEWERTQRLDADPGSDGARHGPESLGLGGTGRADLDRHAFVPALAGGWVQGDLAEEGDLVLIRRALTPILFEDVDSSSHFL